MTEHWSDPGFGPIAQHVSARTGLVFAPNRCEGLELAVRSVMREHAIADLRAFEASMSQGSVVYHALLAQVTVGESYFFRDPAHFRFLSERLLPELDERWGASHRPRVWSAGCAAGEEAYSLAITLQERGRLAGAFVLGTDLNRAALKRARAARYSKWALRGVDAAILERYFERVGTEAVLLPRWREAVNFQDMNLASIAYPSLVTATVSMDLILCRNVLIYLNPEVIQQITRRLFDCLDPGGYLITGPSDPRLSHPGFEICDIEAGLAYRRRLVEAEVEPPRASERVSVPFEPQVLPRGGQEFEPSSSFEQQARSARLRGDHRALQRLSAEHPELPWLVIEAIRTRMKFLPATVVELECRQALDDHPLSVELYYLHALLLLELDQLAAAAEALKKALYLEPTLPIAHFLLGSVLARLHDEVGARRAYRNAEQCARSWPTHAPVRFAEDISGPGLAKAAARELALLRGGTLP